MSAGRQPGLRVAKLLGEDVEFSNAIEGRASGGGGTGAAAAELLLRQIEGVPAAPAQVSTAWGNAGGSYRPASAYEPWVPAVPGEPLGAGEPYSPQYSNDAPVARSVWVGAAPGHGDTVQGIATDSGHVGAWMGYDPQDKGRRYLTGNGGCAYEDLGHAEVCTPEVASARDFVAVGLAMRELVSDAMRAAQAQLPPGERLVVLANNSDGLGHSYGSHLNVLMSRDGFRRIFAHVCPALLVLGAVQASSIVFTGQGKVGAENGEPQVDYQIAQRSDFIETLLGQQTTCNRPLVNSRDEPLCGRRHAELARLHSIFFDHTLCDVARYLKAGMMQIVLAMAEADALDVSLALERPEQAVKVWSHDPSLRTAARLLGGGRLTAVQHQQRFLAGARRFVERGGCEGLVPEAPQIVALWQDTLDKLERRDWDGLAPRLDWVLKRRLIEQALDGASGLDWASPEVKQLDLVYASLDESGLHGVMRRAGLVERLVSDGEIRAARNEPPDDTRAYTRAMLLRRWGRQVESMDWDRVRFAAGAIAMPDPRDYTREQTEALFARGSLATLLAAFGERSSTTHDGGHDS